MTEEEFIYLSNGHKIPKVCVDALWKLDLTWPGASFPRARSAIVYAVIEALKSVELQERVKITVNKNEFFHDLSDREKQP